MNSQDLSILSNKSNTKNISDPSLGRYQSGFEDHLDPSPGDYCSINIFKHSGLEVRHSGVKLS